jgi:hypothetical protein
MAGGKLVLIQSMIGGSIRSKVVMSSPANPPLTSRTKTLLYIYLVSHETADVNAANFGSSRLGSSSSARVTIRLGSTVRLRTHRDAAKRSKTIPEIGIWQLETEKKLRGNTIGCCSCCSNRAP